MAHETIFTMGTSSIKFGPGATREIGADLRRLEVRRALVVTDPGLAASAPVGTVLAALRAAGIDAALFDRVRVEPTDASLGEAIAVARDGAFDGYVAVGGGSSMDTAKAANLYATYPADLLTCVNPPIGEGRPVLGPLKPLIAVPTTAGTGSETTGVVIFDLLALHAKTGIAHPAGTGKERRSSRREIEATDALAPASTLPPCPEDIRTAQASETNPAYMVSPVRALRRCRSQAAT